MTSTKNAEASLKSLEAGGAKLGNTFETLKGAAGQLAGAFGIAFSVGALVGFGRELLADADALMKLHDITGISIEGLQRFRVAGDDSGNTLDDITSAIVKMEDKLAGGDAGAIAALGKLGVSFADLKRLTPEQQFIEISDAVREIKDPAQQVNIAIDLFGKQGATVLPTLKRGFDDLKGSVVGASTETIKFFDDFGDRLGKVSRTLKGDVMQALEFMFGGWTRGERDAKAFVAQLEGIKPPVVAGGKALEKLGEIGTAAMARLKLAEMELTAEAEASIVVNKKRATEAEAAAKLEAAELLTTTKLWDEYYAVRVSHGGTANEIAIADINRWAADTEAAAKKAGTATKGFYAALAADAKEKLAGVGVDWALVASSGTRAQQELADNAWKTYQAMIAAGDVHRDALDKQLAKYRELQAAANGYGNAGVDAAQRIEAAEKRKNEELKRAEVAMEAIKKLNASLSSSVDTSIYNFSESIDSTITGGGTGYGDPLQYGLKGLGLPGAPADLLAKAGYSLEQIRVMLRGGPTPPHPGPRIPGFLEGGPTGAGVAMLHAGEYVVPKGGALVRGGGGSTVNLHPGAIVINWPIMNDARSKAEVGRVLGDLFVERAKQLGRG